MQTSNYKPGDEKAILELFEKVFKKQMSVEYWNWRFASNPSSKIMIRLMWDNDVLAGHYALSPVVIRYDQEEILTALSMTTMTHPDYGGKGIFSVLAEEIYREQYEKNDLKAIWGFPNNNSHYGFIKNLNWKNLEQIPTFTLRPEKFRSTGNVQISAAPAFTEEHVLAAAEVTSGFSCHVKRSREWLQWRYADNPSNVYEIFETVSQGRSYFAVCKLFPSFTEKDRYEVDITELMFPDDYQHLSSLISAILEHYSGKKICSINTWMPLDDKRHILLEKAGFINGLPFTYSGIRLMDEKYGKLLDKRNWYYGMGDSDVY